MCGINGFNFESKKLIEEMNKVTAHRGPDAEGTLLDGASLGHRRLSIIDLSENGKQPMSNETGEVWIVFNGEIYNFEEIKKELSKNHTFRSKSDTEVIIHAYEEWGPDCVKKFNGMWAFCIYDKKKNLFFLSRDRFGVKPLYYTLQKDKFIFSSEIKAILQHPIKKELNKKAASSFLSYRYVLGEETFFKGISKLLPATNLIYNLSTKKVEKTYSYWDIEPKELKISEKEAISKLNSLLNKSIMYRKISDVPLGVILSGGLDSSIVTALLAKTEKKPINTFTIKFKEKGFDETEFAKKVSSMYKTNYFEEQVDTSNFLGLMREYTKFKDEPIGVPNEIALYLLSKKIKKHVTVVLSGEGADEAFEGYGRIFTSAQDFEIMKDLSKLKNGKEIFKEKYSSLFKLYKGNLFKSEIDHFLFRYNYWTDEEKNKILLPEAKADFKSMFEKTLNKYNLPYEKKISYTFLKLHLPALLNRLDSPTMASSIEGREPLLDYNLVDFAFNLPIEYKTKWKLSKEELSKLNKTSEELSEIENTSKYILKEAAKEYLPLEIINRKKQGFPLPLNDWFKGEFLEITKKMLLNDKSKIKEMINQEELKNWIEEETDETWTNKGQKLWMLLSLEVWLQEWF